MRTWETRQEYLRHLGRLRDSASREMDRVQVGDDGGPSFAAALRETREARFVYHLQEVE